MIAVAAAATAYIIKYLLKVKTHNTLAHLINESDMGASNEEYVQIN